MAAATLWLRIRSCPRRGKPEIHSHTLPPDSADTIRVCDTNVVEAD